MQQDENYDDDSDADDDTDSELDETALESYTTPIDDETGDNPINEFVTFQQVMTSKSSIYNRMFDYVNVCVLYDAFDEFQLCQHKIKDTIHYW